MFGSPCDTDFLVVLKVRAVVAVRRKTHRVDDADARFVGGVMSGSQLAQALSGLWTLVVETSGKIVRDRQAVGFFFH